MSYLFLQKDLDLLKKEQEKLLTAHKKIGQDLGEACEQSSETWHDNAPYDDAVNNAKLVEERLDNIGKILESVKIIEIPQNSFQKVGIGSVVKIIDADDKKRRYKIGSYIAYNDDISYHSPLGACLLYKKIGEKCVLDINNQQKVFEILEIK